MNTVDFIGEHDVIQLNPETTENPMFRACFAVVAEVKSWGVRCYVQSLGENGDMGGRAYYNAKFGTFEKVGSARWVPSND